MRLTLQQIEGVFLHDEKQKLIQPAVWSLLYFAARNDGVDAIDALRVIAREPADAGTIIENFLGPDDLEAVKALSLRFGLEMSTPHAAQAVTKRLLDAWVAKTLMLTIAQLPDRRRSQLDESLKSRLKNWSRFLIGRPGCRAVTSRIAKTFLIKRCLRFISRHGLGKSTFWICSSHAENTQR